jgi:hypothetical protein
MKLLADMKSADLTALSPFSRQLVLEDITRLERLSQLERADFAHFRSAAVKLGWTQADARTAELDPELTAFLEAVFTASDDHTILRRWSALHKRRMDLLVGCLSRPRID